MNRMPNVVQPRLALDAVSALQPRRTGGMLREISLELPAGRCLALLGDRDAGGGLLLDVVAGHNPGTTGRILLDGIDINALPAAARRLGAVSPRDPLFPHLSVRGNIAFPLRANGMPAGEREQRVNDAVALLGLEALAGRRPAGLDDPARIRTAIARILVLDPPVMLLDDPFATLDPGARQVLQRMLRRLARARGLTVLLSTGDRDEAMLLGDEVGILEQGRLHQVAPVPILLDRPADPTVAQRLADANLLTGRIIRFDEEVATVRLRCGHEMEAEPGEMLEEGALCVLCVRPDRIAVAFVNRHEAEPGMESLPATLTEAAHLGDHLRLRFRLEDGSELLVRRPPSAMTAELRPDRLALLAWQPHQARVFAAPAG